MLHLHVALRYLPCCLCLYTTTLYSWTHSSLTPACMSITTIHAPSSFSSVYLTYLQLETIAHHARVRPCSAPLWSLPQRELASRTDQLLRSNWMRQHPSGHVSTKRCRGCSTLAWLPLLMEMIVMTMLMFIYEDDSHVDVHMKMIVMLMLIWRW